MGNTWKDSAMCFNFSGLPGDRALTVGVPALKWLIFDNFYFGWEWWSWKDWLLSDFTLRGYGGPQNADSEEFSLISWKDQFSIFPTLRGYDGLERSYFFYSFLLWEVWWFWKDWFGKILTKHLGKIDFQEFPVWFDMVLLEEPVLYNFNIGRVWWPWKELISIIIYFERIWWS